VPLLLSTGFHIHTDLPEAVATASVPVTVGDPLGPDALVADAQVDRLREAGAVPGQRVVLVAAGSTDEAATCDQMGAVALLARAWGSPVELATLSGHGPRPAEVVRPGDAVSPYLLSPGFFHDRVRREAPDGAVVADVIGPHELVVDLVVRRAGWAGPGPRLNCAIARFVQPRRLSSASTAQLRSWCEDSRPAVSTPPHTPALNPRKLRARTGRR
jgi:sirohydrochlorin ferrochelatase